jgi:hypothetical protein
LVSLATFKDICIDASNASVLGAFWSGVLGLDLHHQTGGDAYLTGSTKAHTIWINQVPEPKTVKHRIHLDVYGSSIEDLEAMGATTIDEESFSWVVMADPEGGEFCLFLRDAPPEYRLYELAIDCGDHVAASRWWASVIGGSRFDDDRGFSSLKRIPNVPFDGMSFAPVDEAKTTKNRLHIDLSSHDLESLIDAGATMLRERDDEIDWDVLADPEGNEFCVFAEH